jgi:hypothetical protein
MQERALLFGGEVSLNGTPGHGTRVAVIFPLQATDHEHEVLIADDHPVVRRGCGRCWPSNPT